MPQDNLWESLVTWISFCVSLQAREGHTERDASHLSHLRWSHCRFQLTCLLTTNPWVSLVRLNPALLRPVDEPNPWVDSWEIINMYCFKLLYFGVVFNASIVNWYNQNVIFFIIRGWWNQRRFLFHFSVSTSIWTDCSPSLLYSCHLGISLYQHFRNSLYVAFLISCLPLSW